VEWNGSSDVGQKGPKIGLCISMFFAKKKKAGSAFVGHFFIMIY
jgi:hypothetical protein